MKLIKNRKILVYFLFLILLILTISVLIIGIRIINNNKTQISDIPETQILGATNISATSIGTNVTASFTASTGTITIASTSGTGTINASSLRSFYTSCGTANIRIITFSNKVYAPANSYGLFVECQPSGADKIVAVGMPNLTTINNISYLDTSNVTSMKCMFYNCPKLTSLNLSSWNTSNVTDMNWMFNGCTGLTSLNISNWNTSNVTDMSYMFNGCTNLTSLNVSNWSTGNVTNMNRMFYNCTGLTSINISSWNTSNVTNMHYMFGECSSLTSLNLNSWNTSKVTTMEGMFYNCTGLTSLNISSWNTGNVTALNHIFFCCTSLTSLNIANWNTSKVTNMKSLVCGCTKLTSLDLSGWSTSSATNLSYLFDSCNSLTTVNISNFDMSKATDVTGLFGQHSTLTDIYTPKVTSTTSLSLPASYYNVTNTSDNNSYSSFAKGTFSGSVHLKRLDSYSISYTLNGGTVSGNPTSYNFLSTFTLKNPTRAGYTFAGWTGSNGSTKQTSVTVARRALTGNLSYTANWTANTAVITINKNGSPWSNSGMNVALYSGTTLKYAYNSGIASGSTITWNTVQAGTYNVYAGKELGAKTTLVDTGVDITVSSTGSATINYYDLTLGKGTGISSVTGASTYLSNQTATIGATASAGYTFSSWSVGAGNTPANVNTASTTVSMSRATTLTANAVDLKAPEINITKTDYNTFSWTATDEVGISGYGITTNDVQPTTWTTTGTLTSGIKDIDANTAYTYYVWAKDLAGNVGKSQITAYKITKSQGKGTTLTIKETNVDGTGIGETCVLEGTTLYISGNLKVGYNTLILRLGSTAVQNGSTHTIDENTTISSTAVGSEVPYTVKHWLQNIDANLTPQNEENYTLEDTESLTGITDTQVTPNVKDYIGFTAPETQTAIILGDGTLEINYYYERNKDTPYVVKHWQEKMDGKTTPEDETNYTLINTDNFSGITGKTITPDVRNYEGFISPEIRELTILPDGTGELNYYYRRIRSLSYTVRYLEKETNHEIRSEKIVDGQSFDKEILASTEIVNDIYGYNYDSVSAETFKITTGENILNIYYVKKDSKVVVHHYIYDGETGVYTQTKLVPDVEILGKVEDAYTTSRSSEITANYRCINEEPENNIGKLEEEIIEISYYYELITPTVENQIKSMSKTEVERDEDDNYIVSKEKAIEYEIEYETKIRDYIGNRKVEIVAKLPAEIDVEKSDLKGGIYDIETNTIKWTEEKDIDTFGEGNYEETIKKEITLMYKEDGILENIEVEVGGRITTYYPDNHIEKGAQAFIEKEKINSSSVIVHHYTYDVEAGKETELKLTADEEIKGIVGQEYKAKRSKKIAQNYELVDKTPEGYRGKMEEDAIEVSYYYKLKEVKIEDGIGSEVITDLERDKDGKYVIENGKEIKYKLEYNTKVKYYIGKIAVEIIAKLPSDIDLERSDLKGGIYDIETNTIKWTEERELDTFKDGTYEEKVEKEITIIYKEGTVLENIGIKVDGKTTTYYPEEYLDKGGQISENVKYSERKTGKMTVRYLDIDTNNEIANGYEIAGTIGEYYEAIKKEIPYYLYVKDSSNTKGKITEQETVTYYYRKLNFNFKIENTISSITLNGENIEISDNSLAKIEIKTKEVKDTELIVKYNIKVTNDGELEGTAKIQEILPSGYEVMWENSGIGDASGRTAGWATTLDGNLETDVYLESGESQNLTIALKWQNSEKNLGSKINLSKIVSTKNLANYEDWDKEDNEATSTVIVSIKTGVIVSIIIIIMILVSLGICAYIIISTMNRMGKGPDMKNIRFLMKK